MSTIRYETLKIPTLIILTGQSNYIFWSYRIHNHLESLDCVRCLFFDGPEPKILNEIEQLLQSVRSLGVSNLQQQQQQQQDHGDPSSSGISLPLDTQSVDAKLETAKYQLYLFKTQSVYAREVILKNIDPSIQFKIMMCRTPREM
eukprot:TRINITY_DN3299_c1_g1_i1.p3 TRINITY_DN3299_c1_g1~~TRINITY_DN3299_c1_g1_i1.p3  ORF type:complete len:145 (-),score=21.09 TRINITY_DN3299_c1_g1_i1:1298-1732(-)